MPLALSVDLRERVAAKFFVAERRTRPGRSSRKLRDKRASASKLLEGKPRRLRHGHLNGCSFNRPQLQMRTRRLWWRASIR